MTKIVAEYHSYQRSQLMKALAKFAHGIHYCGQTSSATYPEISTRIQEMGLVPGDRLLDAGCGNGAFSLPLAKEFSLCVEGVDLASELVAEATEQASAAHLEKQCKFSVADFAKFPLCPSNFFHGILCVGSLYWGQPLTAILEEWHRITRPHSQLLLFLNLGYTSLTANEKVAVGETEFFSALTTASELSRHGWALCEWTDATALYIEWLTRWCSKMEEISLELSIEMGEEAAHRLMNRFMTYLRVAKKGAVRRIILRAEHV